MRINADLSRPAAVRADAATWVASPASGVERLMLERDGDEVARATTIVRFAPGSRFPEHLHEAGEEYLVLEGTFSDGDGDFGAGSYVRNPPGSRHAPFTRDGATIFVKLRQFAAADGTHLVVDTGAGGWTPEADGSETLALHAHGPTRTFLLRTAEGHRTRVPDDAAGVEVLVLDGAMSAGDELYPARSWLRHPGGRAEPWTAEGATLFVKTGHLGSRKT